MPGAWRRLAITPPLTIHVGDVLEEIGDTLVQTRAGVVVATRLLHKPGDFYDPPPAAQARTLHEVFYFQGRSEMLTATCDRVEYPPDGSVHIFWGDSTDQAFANRAAVGSYADVETSLSDSAMAKRMIVKAWGERSADFSDPSWIAGKTLQLDLSLDLNQLSIGSL